ncbi:hypothetical protein CUMW_137090, partial [Citrus unshiu]
ENGRGGREGEGLNRQGDTEREVDPRLLKAIKSVVQYSDSELRLAAQTLMDLMKQSFFDKEEIKSTIDEIGERLDIICAKEEIMLLDPLDDEEFEEFRSSELRQVRLDSLKEGEKIHEDEHNKGVVQLLVTKHLVLVQEWIFVLIRVEVSDNRSRDKMLKEFIDIQNRLQLVKKKCEDSGCVLINNVKPLIEDELEEDF